MAKKKEDNVTLIVILAVAGYVVYSMVTNKAKADPTSSKVVPAPKVAAPKAEVTPKVVAPKDSTLINTNVGTMQGKPRGIRNNNPGNIKKSANMWSGKIGHDGTFEVFNTPVSGIRAAFVLFKNYKTLYKLDTIDKIAMRYDKPNWNNWAAGVSKISGFARNTPLDLSQQTVALKFMRGVIGLENGATYTNYYSDGILKDAYSQS